MKRIAFAAIAASLVASGAAHAAKCNIVGNWSDLYGITATFTTEKRGTADASIACSKPYKVVVTTLTKTTWDLTGTAKGCPTAKAALTFATGSCTSASGTVTLGTTSVNDTWTKSAGAIHRAPADTSMFNGLR